MDVTKHLTFADAMRFFDEKAVVRSCPSCASQDWTLQFGRLSSEPSVIFSANTLGIGAPFEAGPPSMPVQNLPFGRPVLPLICKECGYMKIHDFAVVKKWVDEHPAPATEDAEDGN